MTVFLLRTNPNEISTQKDTPMIVVAFVLIVFLIILDQRPRFELKLTED